MNNSKGNFFRIFKKKDSNQKRGLVCNVCEKEKRGKYCKSCKKETQNIHTLKLIENISMKESIGIKQKRLGVKGWIIAVFQGYKPSINKEKFPEGVELNRKVDKEKDWYDEIVKDERTGKIINECHEPLSQHVGHGSARSK